MDRETLIIRQVAAKIAGQMVANTIPEQIQMERFKEIAEEIQAWILKKNNS